MAHNKSLLQRAIRPTLPRYLTNDYTNKAGVVLIKAQPQLDKYSLELRGKRKKDLVMLRHSPKLK